MLPRRFVFSVLSLGLPALSMSALADSSSDIPTITITGTRTAQTVDETLVPVKVISREDIEQSQALDVEDLLAAQAGISLANTGGMGREGSLFIRGAESDHLIVLVDGVKINSVSSGTAAIQNLPLDAIERIEIVRGPRASLYGADALGGVIQFFTKRQPADTTPPSVTLAFGSHNTQKLGANFSARGESSWVTVGVSSLKTDGFNACRAAAAGVGGCFTDEPDADGYENTSLSLSGGATLSERAVLSLSALQAGSEVAFDGDFVNRAENVNTTLGGKLKVTLSDVWDASISLGQSQDESDNYKDATFGSRFNAKRNSFSLQNDLSIGNALLTLGLDQNTESVSGSTQYSLNERDNTGVFVQLQQAIGAHDVAVSLRQDDHSDFGSELTGNLTVGHLIGDNLRLTTSYGTAFKAPTFNELYFPDFGNPDLSAETAASFDLGLRKEAGSTRWALNVFQTDTDNLIAYDAVAGLPINIGKTKVRGAEASLATSLASWQLDSALTYLDTRNQSATNSGKQLPRRPKTSARIDAHRAFGRTTVNGTLRAQSSSFDDLANTRSLAGFATLDLKLGYSLTNKLTLGLALNNVFDAQYETAEYYNQDGLNAMLTVRYRP